MMYKSTENMLECRTGDRMIWKSVLTEVKVKVLVVLESVI